MTDLDINTLSKDTVFHFIGIDGIGMSSIAGILLDMNFKVQGSNKVSGENMLKLEKNGAKIFIGHNENNVKNANYVIYTSAISNDNIELVTAKKNNIPTFERGQFLQFLLKTKISVAITGTHGKTTTTSFVGIMLDTAGLAPSIINGGIINKYGCHYKAGSGKYIVAESCEAFGNIQYYSPDIAVITNLDPEHLEYYKTFDNLRTYFQNFIDRISKNGLLVVCADHPETLKLGNDNKDKLAVLTYGIENQDADIVAKNITYNDDSSVFDIYYKNELFIKNTKISVIGKHNILNALASVAIAIHLDIDKEKITKAMLDFTGTQHRFSKVATIKNNINIYDDYAHHPTEIKSTLEMARIVAKENNIFTIFEPHRFSRLSLLFDDFMNCFDSSNYLIITPVFGAGEEKENYKDETDFYNKIKDKFKDKVFVVKSFDEITKVIKNHIKPNDVVISFSAGNLKNKIYDLPQLLES